MDDISGIGEALRRRPVDLSTARGAASAGGVPAESGLYAWWTSGGALPGIAGPPHPEAGLELLYVGIAPNRITSRSTLRSRLLRNHIGGRTGQSTLRRTLAALLTEQEGYRTRWTTRTELTSEDEQRLNAWMQQNLRLTWAVHPEPWVVEPAVIALLGAPLNLDDNHHHPLYEHVRSTRERWRRSAAPDDG